MIAYLGMVKELCKLFPKCRIKAIPRSYNSHADALAKLASTKDTKLLDAISVEFLVESSLNQQPVMMGVEQEPY